MMAVVCWLLQAYLLILFAHVILSWVPRPPEPLMPVVTAVRAVTEPVLAPVRRLVPPVQLGGAALDLSVIIVFFALFLLSAVVCR
jgi:YggT family protein